MNDKRITNINLSDILPNRLQPRVVFQDDSIDELAESIKKHGVINPITVRKLGNKYEIIAGERRYKASTSIGLKTIPAIIIEADDKESAEIALIENIQRKELSPIEEGISYDRILSIGDITQEELAERLGKKQSTIANKIRLLKLDDKVKEALLNEKISERHARSLLKLYDKQDQQAMLEKIISKRLTVRQADEEIAKIIEEKGEIIDMEEKKIEIPKTSIISDEVKEEITEPGINPSFVDVKKIEEESKDIFVEKPTVNINDLLKTPITNSEEPIVNEEKLTEPEKETQENETSSEASNQPKFFSFFPPEEPVSNVDVQKGESTDILASPVENANISQPEPLQPENNNIIDIEKLQPFATEPVVNVNENNTSNNTNIEVKNDQNGEKEEDLPEMKIDSMMEQESDDSNETFDFQNFNPIIHNDFVEQKEPEEELEFFEEEPQIETREENINEPKTMKNVISVIRETNDIIERYGFRIETEEFDLENMYQVIFKVYKN